jgi:glyoxylase-like metal-dependent hydrolase (beta-lactamase superfamily II)
VKKFLMILAAAFLLLLIIVAVGFFAIFGSFETPRSGPSLPYGIQQVADNIATVFMLDAGNGKMVLIDAGNDPSGAPILEALGARGLSAADVSAIFITHAHPDHDAAVGHFPNAEIYAMRDEVAVAAGKEAYHSPFSKIAGAYNPHPFKVTHPLSDGEEVTVGDVKITAFEVSGHTPGSAIYFAKGVLFTGDAFNLTRDHAIDGPVRIFSTDAEQGIASLKTFLEKLDGRASEVTFIATSHSGVVGGKEGLQMLRDFISKQP